MTSAAVPDYEEYPQYCYHLSPTITKWCPFRASDIPQLRWHPGFQGQDDTFFHLNHPIRWVRVVGVVVAIDSFQTRRVYTVDDSTGVCIECSVSIPQPADPKHTAHTAVKAESAAEPAADLYPDVDVGMVVDVKGNLKLFRDQKVIKIQKLQRIRSTNQEVQFWNKIRDFRSEVLSKPWVLDRKVLRRLEKENKTDADSKGRENKKRRHRREEDARSHATGGDRTRSRNAYGGSSLRKPYQPSKLRSVAAADDSQYDALGL
ncbi:hypothetical protein JX266_006439 [Neoarthrinium moseri]|uniref:uncharacterized protein n=1 Tax=Neoarthrinium moseri TaxID=1658444 RepID=UPI001FDB3D57|nr:uncharacterized protein JN550_007056 [Neoarthrinium moseri]KAI1847587.1 hypothetical protein JX266_006439 [Neoarthrinium moseri]KAI1867325.1 hypothetical protein JN550_007056 [Neoarthrinium moseri]